MIIRHFPDPPRLVITIGGKAHRLKYLTKADVSALVLAIKELCEDRIPDRREAMEALLSDRKVLDPLLMDCFPTAESLPAEDMEVKAGLLGIVWEANQVSEILEDLHDRSSEREEDGDNDPLGWPKFCLHMRRAFGIDEDTMFHRWTYWQFVGFLEAASEILSGDEGGYTDTERKPTIAKRGTIEDLVRNGVSGM
nr:hypothetical protein [uncultured Dethiosulfovibrio sp.]